VQRNATESREILVQEKFSDESAYNWGMNQLNSKGYDEGIDTELRRLEWKWEMRGLHFYITNAEIQVGLLYRLSNTAF